MLQNQEGQDFESRLGKGAGKGHTVPNLAPCPGGIDPDDAGNDDVAVCGVCGDDVDSAESSIDTYPAAACHVPTIAARQRHDSLHAVRPD